MAPKKWAGLILAAALSVGAMVVLSTPVAAGGRLGANYFPNVQLTTQDGKTVRFYDDLLKGRIVAINFIYTHCHFSCPLETARLAQVEKILGDRVGKDVFFYSISIDPKRDTPAELKAYAEKFHAGPGWTFLTGRREDVDLLAVKLGLTGDPSITSGPGHNVDGHTPHLLIGNEATGQWLRDSSTDNPHFLATMIGNFMDPGKSYEVTAQSHSDGAPIRIKDPGRYVFGKECAACHTVGHGDKIGPDLRDVARLRDRAWLARYIAEPDKMLAAGDPIAKTLDAKYRVPMPNLRVGERDLSAIMDFLNARAAGGSPQASIQSDN